MGEKMQASSAESLLSRRQLFVVFALMTLIPLLTFIYLLVFYVNPGVLIHESVLLVVGLNLVLSLAGVLTISKVGRFYTALADYLASIAKGDLSRELPFRAGDGASSVAAATEAIVKKLQDDRKWLEQLSHQLKDKVDAQGEELNRHRRRITQLVEACAGGMLLYDRNGKIVASNARAAEIMGVTREQIVMRVYNSPEWRITDERGEPVQESNLPFRLARDKRGPVKGVRHELARYDGSRATVSVNAVPIFDAPDSFYGVAATIEEVGAARR